jgi:hypothetical protein
MANDLVKLPQLSTHAETKGKILSFHAGQTATVKMEQGLHYVLRRAPKGDANTPLEVPDNVIASRQGDALHLRYSDSSTITFENFYSVCTTDSACSVNLVGDTENGITLSASNSAGGSVSGDTGTLVYAHGNHDVLMSMAQGQSNMAGAFTALGDSPVVTYFPQTLAMEAAGLTSASVGFAAVPALIGGSILMDTGSAGTGSAGNGVAAPSIVNGTIQAGPVMSGNDLLVNIYAGDKTTLLKANLLVDASGHFTTNVGSYVGVVFAQLVVTGTALDYMDEATGVGKNLSSALTAMGVVTGPGSTLSLNLNVLTTIAANKIDPNASVATVNGVNKAVATTFGLTDLQGPVVTTVLSTYNAADGLSAAENYGAVLAALSGMDKLNGGDISATITQLTSSIALSGSGSSSATTLSDAGKYNIAAGAKVVILADSGTVTNQFGSSVATLINYAANPTTGTLGLTAIGNATDSAVGTVPTQFDYANANVTGIDSSVKLQLINDVVKSLVLANVDTVGEVQSLSDAVTAVINSPAGGTPPTWVQLNALGILGITSGNLSAVLAAIANTSPDGSAVDTQAELQALVNTINTAASVISSYAQANTASAPATPTGTAPLLGNYSAAGITGVDSSNLHAINDALATPAITGTQADTPAKIQTIVNAYNAILASADGNAATAATALTAAQFAAIGADIGLAVSSPQILSLLDDSIGRKTAAAVDSVAEVNQLAAAANAVANQAAGISGLTMADLAALGITGITDALGATGSITALSAANIQSILSAISATPDTGTGVDTLAKIQALVNAAVDLTPPTAPVITAIAGDNAINAAEQGAAVSGTAEAYSVITITLGGTSHSVTTDASGNWSYALQPADISAMGQGPEVISVTATDAAGNVSQAGTRTIRIDTLAPTLAMGVIAGDAILNKTEHDALSSTTHLQISGSTTGVEDGQLVAITLNYLQYSATVTGNAWTLNLPNADALALNHGNSYAAIASVSDAAGNVSNVGSSAVLIDIAAPDIPTVHQKVTNNTRPTLSGHAEKTLDAGLSFLKLEVATSDVISVQVNGITYTLTLGGTSSPAGLTYNTGTGDWALDLSGAANPMTNGNYEVAVSVTAAGLTKGDISSNELKINTTGVVVAMAGITSDDAVNAAEKGGTVLLHGTSSNLEAGQTVDLTLVDGSIVHATVQADGSWSTLVAGSSFNAEGAQSVTSNATNAAGTSATPLVHNLLVDSVAPTATVVLANSALLAGQTSTVTITFSEAVSGFDNNDLNVGNGTLSAVSSVDGGITWTATFTPSSNVVSATNAITLNKTGVSDAAGNAGVGSSSSANYAIDTHRPTAAITLSDTALKAGETATATITFSEAVTGFDNGDLGISNGVLSAVSSGDGGITWTATFTPTTDFTAASNFITLSNSGVSNTAGNAGAGQTTSASYAVDTHTPVVTAVTDGATAAITRGTISFTVAFDETLAGAVGIGNFSATNGVITSVTPVDGSHYTVVVTPNANVASGNVALSLVAAGLTDAAGNALANADLSALDSQGVDTRAPSISSVTDNTVATVTNSAITYTVTFDEAVVGTIDRSSFGATSGSITSVNTVDNIHYTVVVTPTPGITSGNVTLSFIANGQTDATGNPLANADLSGQNSQGIDTLAPSTPATAPASYADNAGSVVSAASGAAFTDDSTPGLVIGSLPVDASDAFLYVDGVKVAASYDAATGTLTPTTPLTEGPHSLSYSLTDLTGNESGRSAALTVTVDTTPPTAPAGAPGSFVDNSGTLQNAASAAATTDDTTPGIHIGALPSGVTSAVLYVDGVPVAATYDAVTGALTPTVPLTEGAHTLGYGYVDASGNASASGPTLSITVDLTAPIAPASAPSTYIDNTGTLQGSTSTAATTDDTTPGINIGSLPSGVTNAVLYVDGVLVAATYDAATGALTPTVPLSEGVHTFGYGYVDAAGNASASGPTLSITIDVTPPTAPASAPVGYIDNTGTVQSATSTAATTDDTTPAINIGSLPSGVTDAVLYVDGILVAATYDAATGALTPTAPLTEGAHTFGYGYVDVAGNASVSGPTLRITVDLTAPTAPATAPASYIDSTGALQGNTSTAATADDTTPGIHIGSLPAGVTDAVLYVDGVQVAATYDAATGALTPTVPLTEGVHTFGFGYVDAAGNTSASGPTLSITIDLTAPTAPASAPANYIDNTGTVHGATSTAATTDDTTPGINIGSLPAGVTDAVLYVDGVLVAATYDPATGALTPTVPLTEGAHTFGYGYVDAAGNASASGPTLSITIDLTAPTSPAIAPTSYVDNTGTVQSTSSTAATTDDTTPAINIGSLPSGVTDAVLYVDGVLVAATYDVATGALTPVVPLTEGAHTFGYGYVDAAGNASASGPTLSITIDLTAPTAPATAPANYIDSTGTVQSTTSTAATTDDTTPAINIGNLPSGVTDAVLYVDGVLVAATYDAATGALTPVVPLTEGAHTLGYGYVDAAGNASASGPTVSITVDLTAPTAPTAAPTSYIDSTGTVQSATSIAATTDDTTPGINIGSLPSGVTDAVLYVDGLLVAATYDVATGALTPTVPLSEGAHTFGFGYVDAAGNASASGPTLSITIDLTAPTAPAAAPTSYIDNTGTLQGSTSAAATTDDTTPGINIGSLPSGVTDAVLYVDGVLVAATYDAATGALTPTAPLTEGAHTFGYGYVDAAGNASASGPTLSITVDLTAPTAPASAPTSYIDNTGTVQSGTSTATTTDDTTPGIAIGSLPSGVTDAVLYVDGVLVAAVYDAATGALTPTVPLTEGAHTFGYGYVDAAGNASVSGPTLSITIDVTAPTAPATAPANYIDSTGTVQSTISIAATTDDTTPGINIGSLPAGVTDAVLYVDGILVAATYDAATGALTPTVPLTEGTHTFGYGYVDAAGNASASGPTLSITIDLTAPTAPASTPSTYIDNTGITQSTTSTAATTDDTTPAINIGSLPSGVTDAVLYVDGVLVAATYDAATGALTPTVPLTEGTHTFGYGYVDAAGNASASGPTVGITVDLTAPTAPVAAPASFIDNTGTVQGTSSTAATTDDTTPGINIGSLPYGVTDAVLYVDGVLVAATYDAATGALTPNVPLTEGAHTFGYGYVDAAGNASASGPTLSITVDLTAPTAPTFNAVATDNFINANEQGSAIGGSAEPFSTITLTLANGDVHIVSTDASGNWSYTLQPADITAMGQGLSQISATATDAAGNVSPAGNHNVTLDTIAPTIAIGTIAGNGTLDKNEHDALAATPLAISGSTTGAENGQHVTITLNGKSYDTTVTNDVWSVDLPLLDAQALNHGSTYTATASVADAAGNVSNVASANVVINIAFPDTPTVHQLITNSATPTISGHAEKIVSGNFIALANGDQLAVSVNGGASYSLTVGGTSTPTGLSYNGTTSEWTLDLTGTTAMADGTYDVSVSVTAGSATQPDISLNEVTINTAPVTVVIATITGEDLVSAAEKSGNVILHGSSTNLEAGALVHLTLVNGTTVDATVAGDGSWSTSVAGSTFSIEGAQHVIANATNAAGTSVNHTTNLTADHLVTVDTVAPVVTTVTDSTSAALTNAAISFAVTFDEAIFGTIDISSFSATHGSVTSVASTDNIHYTVVVMPTAGIATDNVTLSLIANGQTDAAGNTMVSADLSAKDSQGIDTLAPTSPTLTLHGDSGTSSSDGITNDNVVNISGLESGATWQYQIDGGSWVTGSGTTFNLSSSAHAYAVRQTDAAGNIGAASGNYSYTLDTTAAIVNSVAITSATGAQNNYLNVGDAVTLTVRMSKTATVTGTPTLGLTIGASTVLASYVSGSGSADLVFSYTILTGQTDANGISIAANSLGLGTGTITDIAGNAAVLSHALVTDNANYMVDTIALAPTLALATDSGSSSTDKITNVANINVTSLEAGATWQYSTDTGSSWTTGSGSTFALSTEQTYAVGTIQVKQTDLAGNTSTAGSNAAAWTYDHTAAALVLNSVNSSLNYLQVPKSALSLTASSSQSATLANINLGGDLTLEGWFNLSAATTWSRLFEIAPSSNIGGNVTNEIFLACSSGTTIGFYAKSFGNVQATIPSLNTWMHVAVTLATDKTATIYINGAIAGQSTLTGLPTDMIRGYTNIGRSATGVDPYLAASVSDIRIYNDARTQAEILNDMSGALDNTDTNLLLNYGFQGNATSSVSGQADATLVNSPTYVAGSATWHSLDNAVNAAATLTEANNIANVKIAVSGLMDGTNEKLIVGATIINANGSVTSGTATESGNSWGWTYAAGTFTFTLNASPTGATTAQTQSLIQGLSYADIATTLTPGTSRVFTITTTDIAGNVGVTNTSTIDVAPVAPSMALATDSGSSATDNITNVATINVVNIEGGATWQYSTDSGTTWNTGTGTSFNLLSNSTHAYAVRQTDAGGNTSAGSAITNFTLDTTAPTASMATATLAPSANASVQSAEAGTAYLVASSVVVNSITDITGAANAAWNQVTIATANSNTNLALTGLNAGAYKLYSVDVAGNLSLASANTVTVDNPPINTVPTTLTLNEDTPTVVTGLSVTDPDAATTLTVTLSALHGTLEIPNNIASGVTSVSNNGTASVTLTGTVAQVNATLAAANGLTYTPVANYNGSDTLTMLSNDGAITDSDPIAITVNAVNDAPTFSSTSLANLAALYSTAAGVLITPSFTANSVVSGGYGLTETATKVGTCAVLNTTYYWIGAASSSGTLNLSFNAPVSNVTVTWQYETNNGGGNEYVTLSANGSVITPTAGNLIANGGGVISISGNNFVASGENATLATYSYSAANITSLGITDTITSGNPNGIYAKVTVVTPGAGTALSSLVPAVTDIDAASSVKGYAVTEAAASGIYHWQYSTNGGTAWFDLSTATISTAFYLAPTDKVRWTGSIDTETALSMVAVDNSGAALHAANAVAGTLDVTTRGGSTAYSANIATLAANATPLILDLNGDGVQTTTVDHGVLFDIANTGALNQTAWANANDGLLVRDINHDGVINNGAELFGNGTLLADGSHAANGFDALAQFDSNHDGKIDAQDAVFQELKVWRDANGDGVSQANELLSMQNLGIVSFNLSATQGSVMENGNTLGLVSSYTTADGAVHDLADVWFQQGAQFTLDTDAAGIHYLHLGTSGQPLDLTSVDTSRLHGVNVIDMLSNSTADSLTIALQQVLAIGSVNVVNNSTAGLSGGSYQFGATESLHQLMVSGDASDSIIVSGGFVDSGLSAVISGHIYEVYNHGSDAQLMVEQAMNRTLMG